MLFVLRLSDNVHITDLGMTELLLSDGILFHMIDKILIQMKCTIWIQFVWTTNILTYSTVILIRLVWHGKEAGISIRVITSSFNELWCGARTKIQNIRKVEKLHTMYNFGCNPVLGLTNMYVILYHSSTASSIYTPKCQISSYFILTSSFRFQSTAYWAESYCWYGVEVLRKEENAIIFPKVNFTTLVGSQNRLK